MEMLQRKPVVRWGMVALAFFLGLAAANGWTTREALDGEGHWWQQYCHQQVQNHVELQQKLDNQ